MTEVYGGYYTVGAGRQDHWYHEETIKSPGAGDSDHSFTPTSGSLQISYDDDGTTKYWNGTAFVAGAPITLSTTINGTQSYYEFTVPLETTERVITFRGWMTRNGYDTPTRIVSVYVQSSSLSSLLASYED